MSRRVTEDDEPGTGTQYYTEATMDPRRDPEFEAETEDEFREAQRWRSHGRTWVCGRDYIDVVTKDVAKLTSVFRKSVWCSTKPAEEGPLYLRFELERAGSLEYQLGNPDEDPTERFIERYRDPTIRGP